MRIGIFAYPSTLMGRGGGLVTLNKSYEHLRNAGYSVEPFDPWFHQLQEFDLIHHFGLGYGNYEWFRVVKEHGKRLAVTTMYYLPARPRSLRWSRKLLSRLTRLKPPPTLIRQMLGFADLILPNSEGEKRLLIDLFGCSEEKISIVPCGVDGRFVGASPEPFQKRFGVSNYLLCVGRFDPNQKNPLGMIRALRDTGLPMVFVGEPATGQDAYWEQCRQEAPPGTCFTGYLDPEGELLASAFAAANTLVVPSFYEYPCMVAMEALLAGTKVAITSGGTTREYFKDYVTYFDPYSPSDMRQAVVRTFQADLDPQAQHYAKQSFLWDTVGVRLEAAYRKAGFID